MKKILLLAILAINIIGCSTKDYQISGEFSDNRYENAKIYLGERINREWVKSDSVVVKNGKFEFSGTVDSVKVCYLWLDATPEQGSTEKYAFILESGKLTVKTDSVGTINVNGTKQNEILTQYKAETGSVMARADDVIRKFEAASKTDSSAILKDTVDAQVKKLIDENTQIEVKYALNNVNTMVGSHIFMNTFYDFTLEQKEALFAKMDAQTRTIPRIAELIAASEVEKKTSKGQPYVDFSMTTPDGKTVKLSDYVGKTDYLLVDFWASWCPDCVASFPALTAFYTKNKGLKFDVIGVSLDNEKERWIGAIAKYKLVWHHVSDLQKWSSNGAKQYAVNAIPTTVLIDKNGKIAARNPDLKELQNLLNQIVTK